MEPGVRRLELVIDGESDGARVDKVIRGRLGLSGAVTRRIKWLPDGILLDGQRVTTRQTVRAGQTLSVRLSDPERRSGIRPMPGPLDIVYEDCDLVVVNKAAGVAVHPCAGNWENTVGNFLLHRYDTLGITDDFHPVHRLDKGTSGLLVIARHPHAQEVLRERLHTGAFRREYLAVCDGVPTQREGVIDAPLGPADDSVIRRVVRPDGQEARTRYVVMSTENGRSLVRLTLETGRTHQIRVHMAHVGCPLTGDFLYGREDKGVIGRPALHSWRVGFAHPLTGEVLTLTAEPPEDMKKLVEIPAEM